MRPTVPSSATVIPDDVMHTLFDVLSPEPLLRLVLCSKALLAQPTHEHVLHSTLMRGGSKRGCISLVNIAELLSHGKLFTPSPLRTLRLACAKRCERVRYGCTSKCPQAARPEFGVVFCWSCVVDSTDAIRNRNANWRRVLEHPRTASNAYSQRSFLWSREHSSGGERCGPLVTTQTVLRLNSGANELNNYLVGATTDPEPLLTRYRELKAQHDEIGMAKYKRAHEGKQRRESAKKQKVEGLVGSLGKLLGDANWAADAQASVLADGLLAPMRTEAPSKATAKALKQIASQLGEAFEPVYSTGFVSLDFLDTDDATQNALLQHCRKATWTGDTRIGVFRYCQNHTVHLGPNGGGGELFRRADEKRLRHLAGLVQAGSMMEALLHGLHDLDELYPAVAATIAPNDALAVFALKQSMPTPSATTPSSSSSGMATFTSFRYAPPDIDALKCAHIAAFSKYEALRAAADEYVSLTWLNDEARRANIMGDAYWMHHIRRVHTDPSSFGHLDRRDFRDLLAIHDSRAYDDTR